MQNKKSTLLIILVIVAIFTLLRGIYTTSGKRKDLAKGTRIKQDEVIATLKRITPLARRAQRSSYSSWGRNPFSRSAIPINELRGLTLNGILWDKENPVAIINDNIVKKGNKFEGYIVVDIKEDSVILYDGTKNFDLRLGEGR